MTLALLMPIVLLAEQGRARSAIDGFDPGAHPKDSSAQRTSNPSLLLTTVRGAGLLTSTCALTFCKPVANFRLSQRHSIRFFG